MWVPEIQNIKKFYKSFLPVFYSPNILEGRQTTGQMLNKILHRYYTCIYIYFIEHVYIVSG